MWEQWLTLFFLGSKITADGDCSHEIKRHLLLGSKVMTNLDSILKSRDITLPTKVHLVKAIGEGNWRRQWQPTPVLLPGKIPWMEETGRLQSMGSLWVRHDWSDLAAAAAAAEYNMRKSELDEAQARIKIAGRNINNLRYADDTTLMAESEEELKKLLMKLKEEREKRWLKTQHSEN